jgi:hypothetical protein
MFSMSIDSPTALSPLLSAQKTASDLNVATVKLASAQIEAQGAAALALIQAIPQINDRLGSNLDVRA